MSNQQNGYFSYNGHADGTLMVGGMVFLIMFLVFAVAALQINTVVGISALAITAITFHFIVEKPRLGVLLLIASVLIFFIGFSSEFRTKEFFGNQHQATSISPEIETSKVLEQTSGINIDELRNQAINNPTEKNKQLYLDAQRLMLDVAAAKAQAAAK